MILITPPKVSLDLTTYMHPSNHLLRLRHEWIQEFGRILYQNNSEQHRQSRHECIEFLATYLEETQHFIDRMKGVLSKPTLLQEPSNNNNNNQDDLFLFEKPLFETTPKKCSPISLLLSTQRNSGNISDRLKQYNQYIYQLDNGHNQATLLLAQTGQIDSCRQSIGNSISQINDLFSLEKGQKGSTPISFPFQKSFLKQFYEDRSSQSKGVENILGQSFRSSIPFNDSLFGSTKEIQTDPFHSLTLEQLFINKNNNHLIELEKSRILDSSEIQGNSSKPESQNLYMPVSLRAIDINPKQLRFEDPQIQEDSLLLQASRNSANNQHETESSQNKLNHFSTSENAYQNIKGEHLQIEIQGEKDQIDQEQQIEQLDTSMLLERSILINCQNKDDFFLKQYRINQIKQFDSEYDESPSDVSGSTDQAKYQIKKKQNAHDIKLKPSNQLTLKSIENLPDKIHKTQQQESPKKQTNKKIPNQPQIKETHHSPRIEKKQLFNSFELENKCESSEDSENYDDDAELDSQCQYHGLGTRGPYKKYSIKLKKRLVNLMGNGEPIKDVSLRFDIPIKNLQRWKVYGAERREGGGRKIMDLNMEVILLEYCIDYTLRWKTRCPRKVIMSKAREFTKEGSKFKGSKGWLDKYSSRTGLAKIMAEFKSLKVTQEEDIFWLIKSKSVTHIQQKIKSVNPLLIFSSSQYLRFLNDRADSIFNFWNINLTEYYSAISEFFSIQKKTHRIYSQMKYEDIVVGRQENLQTLASTFGVSLDQFIEFAFQKTPPLNQHLTIPSENLKISNTMNNNNNNITRTQDKPSIKNYCIKEEQKSFQDEIYLES